MTRRRTYLLADALLLGLLAPRARLRRHAPSGKTIADIIPIGNKVRTVEQIQNQMHSKSGKPYDEARLQEDVRRLHATKWFTPGGVQVHTKNEPDGRVTVMLYVTELTSTVEDVQFVGAQHINRDELQTLSGVRRGDPMNPLSNELGRQALLRKYQDGDGRYYASVELLEGSKPTDTRVVFQVVEGPKVKVADVVFRGNVFAGSGRLRTQLMTSTQKLGFIGGTFKPQEPRRGPPETHRVLQRPRVPQHQHRAAREVVQSEDLGHVTIVYHIVEGPRCQVAARRDRREHDHPARKDRPDHRTEGREVVRRADGEGRHGADEEPVRVLRGYAVGVEQQLYEVPGEPGVVRVQYQVHGDKGEPDRIGRVMIRGNEVTQDRVILNQLGGYLRPGQVLRNTRDSKTRIRLGGKPRPLRL